MQEKLELIQSLAKAIARAALAVENTIDVEVKLGQWNSWESQVVEDKIKHISGFLTDLKKAFKDVKGGQ